MKRNIAAHQIDGVKFWKNVDKSGDCWLWTRGVNTTGYGVFHVPTLPEVYERTGRLKTQLLAHRIAWHLSGGSILGDDEHHVLHKCDNRRCCNPAHLFLGTQQDNVGDMIAKGRGFWQS